MHYSFNKFFYELFRHLSVDKNSCMNKVLVWTYCTAQCLQ